MSKEKVNEMDKEKVFWKKQFIGYLLNGQIDNFFYFGKWIPGENTALLAEFYRKIEEEENEYIFVGDEKKGMIGTIAEVPDDIIDFKILRWYHDGLDNIDYKDLP
jgi:hypothetical protein